MSSPQRLPIHTARTGQTAQAGRGGAKRRKIKATSTGTTRSKTGTKTRKSKKVGIFRLTKDGAKRPRASTPNGARRPSAAVKSAMSKRVSLDVPQIASRALLTPSQVTKELNHLKKRGVVVQVPDGDHPVRFKLSDD